MISLKASKCHSPSHLSVPMWPGTFFWDGAKPPTSPRRNSFDADCSNSWDFLWGIGMSVGDLYLLYTVVNLWNWLILTHTYSYYILFPSKCWHVLADVFQRQWSVAALFVHISSLLPSRWRPLRHKMCDWAGRDQGSYFDIPVAISTLEMDDLCIV